ncbi:MAG TPA: GNAT family N-acetyltransferase [Thermomicrobiales bacterium]|jgi:GNAT superfamily N-acetyltransferase|nr:GNAT family N-acetyltransferase [Thermomicrobiales bacterium]
MNDQIADSNEILIRPATAADEEAIQAMMLRLLPDDTVEREPVAFGAYFAGPRNDHGPEARTVVAVDQDDVPLGYLVVYPEREHFTGERRGYIDHLAVADGAEGRGIGRLLLGWAERWARDEGMAVLSLDVFAGNDRARRLYARNGFRDDFVRMVRRLGPAD